MSAALPILLARAALVAGAWGAVFLLTGCVQALAGASASGIHHVDPARAASAFALVWLLASLRLDRSGPAPRVALDLSPIRRLDADRPRRARRAR